MFRNYITLTVKTRSFMLLSWNMSNLALVHTKTKISLQELSRFSIVFCSRGGFDWWLLWCGSIHQLQTINCVIRSNEHAWEDDTFCLKFAGCEKAAARKGLNWGQKQMTSVTVKLNWPVFGDEYTIIFWQCKLILWELLSTSVFLLGSITTVCKQPCVAVYL